MIRCCTLYSKTAHSPAKLQMTDEGNSGSEVKTLLLENVCVIQKKVSKSKHFKVEIHWRKEKFSFAVDSEHEANSWIDHLNDVAEFDKMSKKILAENLSTSSLVNEDDTEVFVDNQEYQSFDSKCIYNFYNFKKNQFHLLKVKVKLADKVEGNR